VGAHQVFGPQKGALVRQPSVVVKRYVRVEVPTHELVRAARLLSRMAAQAYWADSVAEPSLRDGDLASAEGVGVGSSSEGGP